jgi:hypothetical protein
MHPITAQTPFNRLWPQRPKLRSTPSRPQPKASPPAFAEHDFLVLTTRPDLLPDTPVSLDSINPRVC